MHLAPPVPHPMTRQMAVPRLIIAVACKEASAEKSAAEGKAIAIRKGPLMEVIELWARTTPEDLVETTAKARMRPAEPTAKSPNPPPWKLPPLSWTIPRLQPLHEAAKSIGERA